MALSLDSWWLGVACYGLCHLVHLAWWHHHRPKRDFVALAVLFFLFPLPLMATAFGVFPALIHFWLSAQYVAIYPAFQASSPTLHMAAALCLSPEGIEEHTLIQNAGGLDRQTERADSLYRGGLLKEGGALTASGHLLARFFLLYRRLLGLAEGEG